MLTSRRDYILRIIDEVGLLLRRVLQQRSSGRPEEALQSVVAACERLFNMEAAQLFQFTPDQHAVMLAEGEAPDVARDKILLYAALNEEAGRCYQALGNTALARQSYVNALRLTLKSQDSCQGIGLPAYASDPRVLLRILDGAALDPDTAALVAEKLTRQSPNNSP